jgi:hypothetical protein|tara:strand:+ start:244 stop:630 length:387 start_codon:yes stop_codon:yes gene_type:complete
MPILNMDILRDWYPEGTMRIDSKVDGIECTTLIDVDQVPDDMIREDYEDKVRRRLATKYRAFKDLETKNPVQYKKYIDATNGEGTFILSDLYERQSRAKKSNEEKAISLVENMSNEEKERFLAMLQSK